MARVLNLHVPAPLLALAALDVVILYVSIAFGLVVSYSNITSIFHSDPDVLTKELVFVGVSLLMMFSMGLYRREYLTNTFDLLSRLAVALSLTFVVLTILFYLVPYTRIWISALLPSMALAAIGSVASRGLFLRLADLSSFKQRILVLGTGRQAERIEALERDSLPNRFLCVGFVELGRTSGMVTPSRVLADSDLVALCERSKVDIIVLALDERRGVLPIESLLALRLRGIRVLDISSFLEQEMGRLEIDSMRPSWLALSDAGPRGRIERATKRIFDVVVALVLLLATLPLTVPTVLGILAEDRGPIFYRQERVGLAGRRFKLLKFRSMHVDAERDGVARWAALNDPRVTFVGGIIRKLRIDEIPQVYNVLRGEMSFIGPRPERPSIVNQLAQDIPFYQYRHSVKPGITGWAQINYPYGASVQDAIEKLKYDLYYIKNYSLFLDLVILVQTLRVVLWPQGAR
jgi:sugar transferase (PEP-CTERM system associated)